MGWKAMKPQCMSRNKHCLASVLHFLSGVIESEQHKIYNQTISNNWSFETIVRSKREHQRLGKKGTFYILPLVIFYLQTSVLEQGVDALSQKTRNYKIFDMVFHINMCRSDPSEKPY